MFGSLAVFALLGGVNGQCVQEETEWSQQTFWDIADATGCNGGTDGATVKKWPDAALCSGQSQHQAAFEMSLANAMWRLCSSFCLYNYLDMADLDPEQYFLWNTNQNCWQYAVYDGGNTQCVGTTAEAQTEISAVVAKYQLIADCPTLAPTEAPTDQPTLAPTLDPTDTPTLAPTDYPTLLPTWSQAPTESPTASPTTSPTAAPTTSPTTSPTAAPTTSPTTSPTNSPTEAPTPAPTQSPTKCVDGDPFYCFQFIENCWSTDPTTRNIWHTSCASTCNTCDGVSQAPSSSPTFDPTNVPTPQPTLHPTDSPTTSPTASPTTEPTLAPTNYPTPVPTLQPTVCFDKELCFDDSSMDQCYSSTTYPVLCPEKCTGCAVSATVFPSQPPTTAWPTRMPTVRPSLSPTPEPSFAPTDKLQTSTGSDDPALPLWVIILIASLLGCIFLVVLARLFMPNKLKVITPRWREPPMWWRQAVEKRGTAGGEPGERRDSEDDLRTPRIVSKNRSGETTYHDSEGFGGGEEEGRIRRNTTRNGEDMSGGQVVKENKVYGLDGVDSPRMGDEAETGDKPMFKNEAGKGKQQSLWIVNRTNSGRIAIQAVAADKKDKEKGGAKPPAVDVEAPPAAADDDEIEVVQHGAGVEMTDMQKDGLDSPSVRAQGAAPLIVDDDDADGAQSGALPDMAPQANSGADDIPPPPMEEDDVGPGVADGFSSSPELQPHPDP